MEEKLNLPALSSDTGFHQYLQEINKIPSLSKEEEFMLAKAYLEDRDIMAAHKLVTSHLKLVAKIAMSYKNYGLPVVDLVSEGNLGLMQAVKKYDPDLGHRLSTYAMWWIKASIQEYILRSWSLVKIGTTAAQKKLFFSLRKIKNRLSNKYSRYIGESDMHEVAEMLNVTDKEAIDMNRRISEPDMSLNVSVDRDGDSSSELIEYVPDAKPSQELVVADSQEKQMRHKILINAMAQLNDREAYIIKERKLKDSPSTLDDLSKHFGISKERVRQIESRAFEKLQQYATSSING